MIKKNYITQTIEFFENCKQEVLMDLKRLKKIVPQDCKLRAAKHGNGYQYFIKVSLMPCQGVRGN